MSYLGNTKPRRKRRRRRSSDVGYTSRAPNGVQKLGKTVRDRQEKTVVDWEAVERFLKNPICVIAFVSVLLALMLQILLGFTTVFVLSLIGVVVAFVVGYRLG